MAGPYQWLALEANLGPEPSDGKDHHTVRVLAAILSLASLAAFVDAARLAASMLFVRSLGQQLRDRDTADKGKMAFWVTVISFVVAFGIELVLRLATRSGFARDDRQTLDVVLSSGLSAARLLMLLAGVFALLCAKGTVIRHLRAAVRAEVP
jgi:hypothetical protein